MRILSQTAGMLAAMLATYLAVAAPACADPPSPRPMPAVPLSSGAERVYDIARPKLLQIRTLVAQTGRQSSLGSGFLVSADGLAITNYHVVSQYALEPQSYRLEYTAVDGNHGALTLLAFDLANDLAVVRLDKSSGAFLSFDERALSGGLPHGERLYSMGNPLDLGFSITEGTYNGLVGRSYSERIHFSGAMNPGMSGGPTVTVEGRVAGINVAKRLGGELVGFLVPAGYAATLLERVRHSQPLSPTELRAEIGRQLTAWQTGFYTAMSERGFRASDFGPYRAPESEAPWFDCWGRTNDGQSPRPRATLNSTSCSSDTRLFVANDLVTGGVQFSHSLYHSVDLNAFQFAAFLSNQQEPYWWGGSRKWHTRERCKEDFVEAGGGLPMRVVWCARAYREFAGLVDVRLTAITQDRDDEALVSRLTLSAITFDNAVSLTRHFLDAITWNR
jgi:S1-C subfamily serine protease